MPFCNSFILNTNIITDFINFTEKVINFFLNVGYYVNLECIFIVCNSNWSTGVLSAHSKWTIKFVKKKKKKWSRLIMHQLAESKGNVILKLLPCFFVRKILRYLEIQVYQSVLSHSCPFSKMRTASFLHRLQINNFFLWIFSVSLIIVFNT